MQHSHIFTLLSFLIVIFIVSDASRCSYPPKVIEVNQLGLRGSFRTIQSAIESLPEPNTRWAHIRIASGTYTEAVYISKIRPCIILEGAGRGSTIVESSNHDTMSTSATFASIADDVLVWGITFQNTYNRAFNGLPLPALAAKIEGDRTAIYSSAFIGLQDTLWDRQGRHYFWNCYIQGGVDFIFGDAQSIYERSVINFTMGADGPKGLDGIITAQKRESMESPTGFVIKNCYITGNGAKVHLGRAYGPYSRVIVANSIMDDVIHPEGWSAWNQVGHEANLTFLEVGNRGPGADISKRVSWMKKMDAKELMKFLSVSFINLEGWIQSQPGFISFSSLKRNAILH